MLPEVQEILGIPNFQPNDLLSLPLVDFADNSWGVYLNIPRIQETSISGAALYSGSTTHHGGGFNTRPLRHLQDIQKIATGKALPPRQKACAHYLFAGIRRHNRKSDFRYLAVMSHEPSNIAWAVFVEGIMMTFLGTIWPATYNHFLHNSAVTAMLLDINISCGLPELGLVPLNRAWALKQGARFPPKSCFLCGKTLAIYCRIEGDLTGDRGCANCHVRLLEYEYANRLSHLLSTALPLAHHDFVAGQSTLYKLLYFAPSLE